MPCFLSSYSTFPPKFVPDTSSAIDLKLYNNVQKGFIIIIIIIIFVL